MNLQTVLSYCERDEDAIDNHIPKDIYVLLYDGERVVRVEVNESEITFFTTRSDHGHRCGVWLDYDVTAFRKI